MLLPVSGLACRSERSCTPIRYAYLPLLGPTLGLVLAARRLAASVRARRALFALWRRLGPRPSAS